MSFSGIVQNGVVVLDSDCPLADGTRVEIRPQSEVGIATKEPHQKTLAERFAPFIGCIDDLPEDMAAQHDHYIHGTPKDEKSIRSGQAVFWPNRSGDRSRPSSDLPFGKDAPVICARVGSRSMTCPARSVRAVLCR